MRILAISASTRAHLLGGMEDHLHTLMGGLADRGHEITVVTARHPDGLEEELADGVRWIYVDSGPHWLDPSWPAASVAATKRLLAESRFDVIHSQSSGGLAVVKASIPGAPPLVLSLHGGTYVSIAKASFLTVAARPTPRMIARTGLDLATILATHVRQGNWRRFRGCEATVPSHAERMPARLAFMLEKDHVHIVPNGIDTEVFSPGDATEARMRCGLPPHVPLALCAGRLDRGKGIQYAIEALARLGSVPDACLALAGDGGKRAEFERLAKDLGIADRVIFLGRITPERVALAMQASDVVLYPSLLGEAFGLVVAQAMASGKPVIASNRGAIPEVLGRDGHAGVLVPAGRSEPISRELGRLFANPQLRERMGQQGREIVLRKMTVERMIEATSAVYGTAIRRSCPTRTRTGS